MNRQQRRRSARLGGGDYDASTDWDSSDLEVPIGDFMRMYGLTEAETRAEGGAGRIVGGGVRLGPRTWGNITFRESTIIRWLRSDLPPAIATKVAAAGGFDRLTAWRNDYFSKIQWLWEENAVILPNGERLEGVRVRREDVERLWGGPDRRH
jgi:hypothetical protein